MCFSAQVWSDYRKYVRAFGAKIDIREFHRMFSRRLDAPKDILVARAVEAAFDHPQSEEEHAIKDLIDRFRVEEAGRFEQLLFEQKTRLVTAERKLEKKETKGAREDVRIATNKIAWAREKVADLHRTQLTDDDSRIYPGSYLPVMVVENGELVIKPMRYRCRPAGKPASYDRRYSGTYNARLDSLDGFWADLFGFSHGIMVASKFFESVPLHRMEHRELRSDEEVMSQVLEFRPQDGRDMLVACLWSHWVSPDQPDLYSVAAITDDPPPEVAAAGHDRCIVPIRRENLEVWLNPDRRGLDAQYAILKDRERPYYEHRMAA